MIWLAKIFKAAVVDINKQAIYIDTPTFEANLSNDKQDKNEYKESTNLEYVAKNIVSAAKKEAGDILEEATKEASEIIDHAKKEIQSLEQKSKSMIENERTQALEAATSQGYTEGYAKGKNEADAIINEALDIKTETLESKEKAIKEIEPQLVELIIDIIKKLAHTSLQLNPQIILHLARQGLCEVGASSDISLRISNEEYDFALQHKDELMEYLQGGTQLEIIKDFSLNKGDCVIETSFGVIDTSFDMQLAEIIKDLQFISSNKK